MAIYPRCSTSSLSSIGTKPKLRYTTTATKMLRFFWLLDAKNRPEPNKTGSVWTGSRFGSGYINKDYYFSVWLNFWVKTEPDRTVNTLIVIPVWTWNIFSQILPDNSYFLFWSTLIYNTPCVKYIYKILLVLNGLVFCWNFFCTCWCFDTFNYLASPVNFMHPVLFSRSFL